MAKEIVYKDTNSLQEIISTLEECGALAEHDKQIRVEVIDEIIKIAIAEIDFESREEQHRFVGFMKQLKGE